MSQNIMFVIVLLIMMFAVVLAVYYLGVKFAHILGGFEIDVNRRYTMLAVLIVAVILVITKSAFMGWYLYMILLFILSDIVKAVLKLFEKEGKVLTVCKKIYRHGMFVVAAAFLITIFGAYNAKNTVVKEYNIKIDKNISDDINIIMISDVHAGNSINKHQLDNMLNKVNKTDADIICLVGDIFDESSNDEIIKYACETFGKMKSKYGIYYVSGNHDADMYDKFQKKFEKAGIQILDDEVKLVNNSFYLVGRQDSITGERDKLSEVLNGVNEEFPIIVLDHRPENISEAKELSVDLQLSGHTHSGQVVPGNFFVHLANDVSYGYKKYGDFNIVVSSGTGTWGVPVRTGSNSEIVKVVLQGHK